MLGHRNSVDWVNLTSTSTAGVTKALEIIHKELDLTMAFCGHTHIGALDTKTLLPGSF